MFYKSKLQIFPLIEGKLTLCYFNTPNLNTAIWLQRAHFSTKLSEFSSEALVQFLPHFLLIFSPPARYTQPVSICFTVV